MKKLLKTSLAFALVSTSSLFGCLSIDDNRNLITDACDFPPITAQQACAERGLSLVAGCLDDGSQTDCQQVSFLQEGDCGEETGRAICANLDGCMEPQIGFYDPCEAEGLSLVWDANECDVVYRAQASRGAEPVISTGSAMQNREDVDDLVEDEVDCPGATGFDGEEEMDCGERRPPQMMPPAGNVCVEKTRTSACGAIQTFLCAVPNQQPQTCDDLRCAPGSRCEERGVQEDCGPGCESSVPVCVPFACPEIYSPVCGVDGETYENPCSAGDVDIAHEGECHQICPAIYAPVCGIDGRTYDNDCMAGWVEIAHEGECELDCPLLYEPVCGADGITYPNDCLAQDVEILHRGECDVEMEAVSCLDHGLITEDSLFDIRIAYTRLRGSQRPVDVTLVDVEFELLGQSSVGCAESGEGNVIGGCLPVADHILVHSLSVFVEPTNGRTAEVFTSNWFNPIEGHRPQGSEGVQLEGFVVGEFAAELNLSVNGEDCVLTTKTFANADAIAIASE